MVLATYYELLKEYTNFKTVHDTNQFSSEAEKTTERIKNLLKSVGFEIKECYQDDIPILIAKYILNKNLPTALIYTNYDSECFEFSPEWKNNPFHLYLWKDEVIGKGVAEHKGQFMIFLTTILHLIENNKLGYNITLLIDGTQNKVGTDIIPLIENNKAELYADFCFFSTGHGIQDKATIEVGQRGSINFDIVLSNPPSEGGQRGFGTEQIINPNLEMSKILNRMYNGNKIAIPYFYYNVEKAKQEVEIKRYGTNLEYKTITKANNKNYTILEPTLEITGIISLPKFEKSNVFPKKTIANLHMNIVNNQNYQEIINGLQQRLKYNIPKNLKTELIIHEAYNPCKYHPQNPYLQKATALLTGAYTTPAEYQQKPHGIKIAQTIQTSVCEHIIAIPFAHQESNIWLANEHLRTDTIKKAFDFCMAFFSK